LTTPQLLREAVGLLLFSRQRGAGALRWRAGQRAPLRLALPELKGRRWREWGSGEQGRAGMATPWRGGK